MGRGAMNGRCFERNFITDPIVYKTQKKFLIEQKKLFQNRLDIISKRLENL